MTTTVALSSIDNHYIESLASKDPGWLASMRRQAFSHYQSLPAEGSPLYSKYSDANKIKPESVHFTAAQAARPASLGKDMSDRLKELEQETGILQVGPEIIKVFVSDNIAKQGVIVSGLK